MLRPPPAHFTRDGLIRRKIDAPSVARPSGRTRVMGVRSTRPCCGPHRRATRRCAGWRMTMPTRRRSALGDALRMTTTRPRSASLDVMRTARARRRAAPRAVTPMQITIAGSNAGSQRVRQTNMQEQVPSPAPASPKRSANNDAYEPMPTDDMQYDDPYAGPSSWDQHGGGCSCGDAACGGCDMSGPCGRCCGPVYVRGEYLAWWIKGQACLPW